MKITTLALAVVVLFGGAVVAPAQSAQPNDQAAVAVRDFDVFVDPPTGYTFVKLPSGWKFVGKVEQSELAKLPPTVLTSLIPGRVEVLDDAEIKTAKADATH